MAVAPKLPDFNARTAPVSARLTQILEAGLWLLVATPFGKLAVPGAVSVVMAIAVTRPLRYERGFWLELLFVALFFTIREIIMLAAPKTVKSDWFQALLSGRPRFGPLMGPRKQYFQFILRCSASLELRLPPEIESLLQKTGDYSARRAEAMYHRSYQQAGFEQSDWPQVWESIQRTEFAGVTYGGIIHSSRWEMFWLRYDRVLRVVLPLSTLYVAGMVWLIGDMAQGKNPLSLAQFTLAAGFVIAFIIFINYTASFRILTILEKDETEQIKQDILTGMDAKDKEALTQLERASDDETAELQAELEPYAGKQYYPTISIKAGYIEGIRDQFLRYFFFVAFFVVAGFTLLLLIQWPIAYEFSRWPGSQVNAWTERMIAEVLLVPVALGAVLALAFIILSWFKKFVGILATGLLLAVVPPLITYAMQGSVGNVVLISSIVTAAIGALPAAVAELIRQKPGINAPTEEKVS